MAPPPQPSRDSATAGKRGTPQPGAPGRWSGRDGQFPEPIAVMTGGIYGPANPQTPPEASGRFQCFLAIRRSFVFPGLVGEVALEAHLIDLRPLLLRPLHMTFFHLQYLG